MLVPCKLESNQFTKRDNLFVISLELRLLGMVFKGHLKSFVVPIATRKGFNQCPLPNIMLVWLMLEHFQEELPDVISDLCLV